MNDLAQSWTRTAGRFAPAGDLARVGADLLERYAEQHRHYHDLAHLADVLRHVDELQAHAADADVVRLAAWFHDAVYDPQRDDNEERSARLAQKLLEELNVPPGVAFEVARLVRATALHAPVHGDANAQVLCDADLAILAADQGTYASYRDRIRAEYAHLDDASFIRGRSMVLRRLLALDPLFRTGTARLRWQQAARQNMAAELAAIS